MKKWKVAAAALCVCFLLTAAYAASGTPGGQTDPLVTLSYLNDTFFSQLMQRVDQRIADRTGQALPGGGASASKTRARVLDTT